MTDERPPVPEKSPAQPEKPAIVTPDSTPEPPPVAETDPSDPELDDLFKDVIQEETPEDIKRERDELREQMITSGGQISRLMDKQQRLKDQLESQKQESAQALQRIQRQVDEQKDFALEKFVKDVLPVIDNLERALDAAKKTSADPKADKIVQGVEKTIGQLTTVFNKFGIKVVDPLGQPCDPNKHEVIDTRDDDGVEPDTVVQVVRKGYELNGRIVRTAQVIVKP